MSALPGVVAAFGVAGFAAAVPGQALVVAVQRLWSVSRPAHVRVPGRSVLIAAVPPVAGVRCGGRRSPPLAPKAVAAGGGPADLPVGNLAPGRRARPRVGEGGGEETQRAACRSAPAPR